MKKFIIAYALVFCSCNNVPPHQYKYTVWEGTAVLSVGDETDKLDTIGNAIVYTNKEGVRVSIDKSKVYKVEQFTK